MKEHIQESGAGFQVLGLVSLVPSPSCAEREKGSGEESHYHIPPECNNWHFGVR